VVRGTLTVDGEDGIDPPITVRLTPLPGRDGEAPALAPAPARAVLGSFRVPGVLAGRYRVSAALEAGDASASVEVTVDGEPLLDVPLELRPPD
jgi:hypothetical protein